MKVYLTCKFCINLLLSIIDAMIAGDLNDLLFSAGQELLKYLEMYK